MAAVWLKRRKQLAQLLDPLSSSEKEEAERKLPKEGSEIAAIRREVFVRSLTVDDSDLEFLPAHSATGSPATSQQSLEQQSPRLGTVHLSEPTSSSDTSSSSPSSHESPSPASPSTVRSSIARRRSSVNLRQPLPDTEGGLIDFLERRRVVAAKTLVVNMWKKRQRGILTGEVVTPAYEELQLITQVLRPPTSNETMAVSDCRFLVESEEIAAAINWIVTRENKNIEGPGRWAKTSTSCMKEWVKKLLRIDAERLEMERQAQGWLQSFRQIYMRAPQPPVRDYSFDHRVRVVDFWYEYHKEAWNHRQPGLRTSSAPAPEKTLKKGRSETSLQDVKLPAVKNITRERYLKHCNGMAGTPLPIPFMMGETKDLDLKHDISDTEVLAIAAALATVQVVQKVDLHGNALVSDKAIGQLLQRLQVPKLASKLLHLSIGGCTRAGPVALEGIIQLVSDAYHLKRLDLSHVKIEHHRMLFLCEAISERTTLEFVSLSGTTFGNGPTAFACQCVSTVLQGHVQELDLSWNGFRSEIFKCLGETLAKRKMVTKLNLSNCAGSGMDRLSTPVNYYLEQLANDSTLRALDLTMNRMDFRSALILEDAVQQHRSLRQLQLSDNPLGTRGLRSVLRAVATATNQIEFFDTSGCYGGEDPSIHDNEVFKSSELQGAGCYNLQLHRPYHRALLRMLYKAAEKFHLSPAEVFIVNSEGGFSHGSKNKSGIWEVPTQGEVSLSFNLERCLESSIFKGLERDFETVIKRFNEVTRHQLDAKQAIPVFGRWYELDGSHHAQTVLLKALSNDFVLSLTDLRVLAATSQLAKPKCIINLLPSIARQPGSYFVAQGMYSTTYECVTCRMQLRQLNNFSTTNPTGHYKLDLENRADYAVAEMLRLIDKWEVLMDKKFDRPDISMHGTRSHARHVFYQGKPVVSMFGDWKLASHDTLELDYSSSFGPPAHAKAISQESFEQILDVVHNPLCNPAVQVEALKMHSGHFYLTCRQLRQLIGVWESSQDRIELCVTFFNRIVDPWNAKLYRGRLESFNDLLSFKRRVGMARSFPYIQPELELFHLDLRNHDERACVANLLLLSNRENPGYIRNPVYILPDGTIDPLKMGIPRSWEFQERVPQRGTFKCAYVCAPDERNWEYRKKLFECFALTELRVSEKEVNWWTNVHEVPTEAIEFVLFCKEKRLEMSKVFDIMDGADGNGEVGMLKLMRGLENLGWPSDLGDRSEHELKEMYLSLYRCVQAKGHGTLMRSDWHVLQQIKNDVELSCKECLQFLLRVHDGSWNRMWSKLDFWNAGSLDRQRWRNSTHAAGYFGPVDIIFRYATTPKDTMTMEILRTLEPVLSGRPVSRASNQNT